jgi:hypothetical protein
MGTKPIEIIQTLSPQQLEAVQRTLSAWGKRALHPNTQVGFNTEDVPPSGGEFLTRDSYLVTNFFCNLGTTPLTVTAKILLPDGRITVNSWTYLSSAIWTKNQKIEALTEGFLLSLCVSLPSAAGIIVRGQCYVQVGLQTGAAVGTPVYRTLISDYLTTNYYPGWPESQPRASVDGRGWISTVTITAPGAGADWSYSFAASIRVALYSISCVFTTAVAVANRIPLFKIVAPAGSLDWQIASSVSQPASQVSAYNLAGCLNLSQDALKNFTLPIPETTAYVSGLTISAVTTAIQAADQWSNIYVVCESWPEA